MNRGHSTLRLSGAVDLRQWHEHLRSRDVAVQRRYAPFECCIGGYIEFNGKLDARTINSDVDVACIEKLCIHRADKGGYGRFGHW